MSSLYAPEICLSDDLYYRMPRVIGEGHGIGSLIETASTEYEGADKPKEGLHHYHYRHNPDAESYRGPDSGCAIATKFLGRQSKCQECPFEDCRLPNRKLE